MGRMAETKNFSYWCYKHKETKISDSLIENSELNSYLCKKYRILEQRSRH